MQPETEAAHARAISLAKECAAHSKAHDFAAALEAAVEITRLLPQSRPAHLRVASVYMQSGQPEQALIGLRELVARWPLAAEGHAALARALLRTGDIPGSVAASQLAIALEPTVCTYYEQLARTMLDATQADDALAVVTSGIARADKTASILALQCRVLQRLGRADEARGAAEESLAINPDQPQLTALVETIPPTQQATPEETKTAVAGKDGFLFHEIDSAFAQMCGVPAERQNVLSLIRVLEHREQWCSQRGIVYRMLIVPERHVLYDDKLPDGHSAQRDRMAVQLMAALPARLASLVLYPFEIMRAARSKRDVCLRKDVHWTSYGAYLGYRTLLESIEPLASEILPESSLSSRIARRVGDMGFWMDSREREECEVLEPPAAEIREVFSTKTFKPGQVDVIETDFPGDRRLVLFRTSNSTAMLPLLAHHFSRIVTVAAVSVNHELLLSEQPHYVFSEIPERYLARPVTRGEGLIRLPTDLEQRSFFHETGCSLPLP